MGSLYKKVLVIGADSFTGRYLLPRLKREGVQVCGTSLHAAANSELYRCDITHKQDVFDLIREASPDGIVHLAGISLITHEHDQELYRINLFGAQNVLEACRRLETPPRKIIMAGSAVVYGQQEGTLNETLCPAPGSHYALSKLCLEHLAATCFSDLNILVTRPFNYTGPGQSTRFVIPKIVDHFLRGASSVALGNIDVIREFNDVRMIVDLYARLLENRVESLVVNLCSGRGYSLRQVLKTLQELTGHRVQVIQSKEFMRPNEMQTLIGNPARLERCVGEFEIYPLRETLAAMLDNSAS